MAEATEGMERLAGDQLWATYLEIGALVVTVFFTGVAAWGAAYAARGTREANKIQQEMIKAGQWVHIDICPLAAPSAPLTWDGDKLSLRFKISLENVGVGPAINVVARGRDLNEMFVDDSAQSIEEIKGMCKAWSNSLGQIIKPGNAREFPINIEIGRERAEVMLNGRGEFPSIGIIFVMCCAYYQTPYSEEGFFKRFAFTIMKANGDFGAPIESNDIPLGIDNLIIRRTMADGPKILGNSTSATQFQPMY
jgi:hypothetical protein